MNKRIPTILALVLAVLTAHISSGDNSAGEEAKQNTGSHKSAKTTIVTLADGSEIEVISIRITAGYAMLILPNGGQVAYAIGDVDPQSLPKEPETNEAIEIDFEGPPHNAALSKYANELKTADPTKNPGARSGGSITLLEVTQSSTPTAEVSHTGSTGETQSSTDASPDFIESLIAKEEEEHIEALLWYEDQIRELANLRTELARAWNRASAACEGSTFVGAQAYGIVANSWDIWRVDARAYGWIDNSTTPTCRARTPDMRRLMMQHRRAPGRCNREPAAARYQEQQQPRC